MTREIHTQRGRHHTHAFFLSPRHLLRVLVFLCICRSDIWVPRSVSMYTPIDDDTFIASRRPRPPRGPFGSPLARSSSSHTRARERTRRANERTHARTRAGIFFFFPSISSCRRSPVRVASSVSTASAVAHSRGHAMWMFGDARDRDAGDAETREGARGMCGMFFWGGVAFARASSSRRRRAVVARTTTGRRPDDDDASTG